MQNAFIPGKVSIATNNTNPKVRKIDILLVKQVLPFKANLLFKIFANWNANAELKIIFPNTNFSKRETRICMKLGMYIDNICNICNHYLAALLCINKIYFFETYEH